MQEDGTISLDSALAKIPSPPEFKAKTSLEFGVKPGRNAFDFELPVAYLKGSSNRR